MDPDTPSYQNPVEVGQEIVVTGTLAVTNSAGGTTIVKHDGILCRVTKAFWDYECGWRYHGTPVDESDLTEIRRQGTADIDLESLRLKYPEATELHDRAAAAQRNFDPAKIYFSEHDVALAPGARLG